MTRKAKVRRVVLALALSYLVIVLVFWITALVSSKPQPNSPKVSNNKSSVTSPARARTLVVIVGYMRSGSSLTGNLLQDHPDVFYVFEPLHDLVKKYIKDMEEKFPVLRFKSERPLMAIKTEVQQLFWAWFTCDLDFIQEENYRYHFSFFQFGLKTKFLQDCLTKTTNTAFKYSKKCTDLLRKNCLQSKYVVIKTIRSPLHWLYELMEEIPNMKIIHLVRDPRAVLVSQHQFGECAQPNGGMPGCSKFLCSSMEDDVTTFNMFEKLFPGRVTRVKYEDLATDPVATTRSLYNSIDLEFTSQTENLVINMTMAGLNSTHVLDTVRPNSRDMVDKWRTQINDRNLDIVQTICRHVMTKLAYHHFIRPI